MLKFSFTPVCSDCPNRAKVENFKLVPFQSKFEFNILAFDPKPGWADSPGQHPGGRGRLKLETSPLVQQRQAWSGQHNNICIMNHKKNINNKNAK